MSYYGISDIGLVREENQDSCYATAICGNASLYIVCDGMGGENGGKTASNTAIKVFCESLQKRLSDFILRNRVLLKYKKNIPTILYDALDDANTAVHQAAVSDPQLSGMGTTLVAALVIDNTAFIINVGDSRAYVSSGDNIKQITKDHSYVQFLLDMGKITEEEFKNHPQKNVITRSVGVDNYVLPDIFKISLVNGQYLLLCSDGLTNAVEDAEICRYLNDDASVEEKSKSLVELAKQNGSSDNITILLVQFEK